MTIRDDSPWLYFSMEAPLTIPPQQSRSIYVYVDWELTDIGTNEDRIIVESNDLYMTPFPDAVMITAVRADISYTTVASALELVSTLECISVYSSFNGDDNGNNQAILEYKKSNSSEWITAHHMTSDRREAIISGGSTIDNPY